VWSKIWAKISQIRNEGGRMMAKKIAWNAQQKQYFNART
jgi:hypothetical protein